MRMKRGGGGIRRRDGGIGSGGMGIETGIEKGTEIEKGRGGSTRAETRTIIRIERGRGRGGKRGSTVIVTEETEIGGRIGREEGRRLSILLLFRLEKRRLWNRHETGSAIEIETGTGTENDAIEETNTILPLDPRNIERGIMIMIGTVTVNESTESVEVVEGTSETQGSGMTANVEEEEEGTMREEGLMRRDRRARGLGRFSRVRRVVYR
jgi:hypothetical protein